MKGDIAFAGFVLTAEEWREMDARSRAQLMAAVLRRDEPWMPSATVDEIETDSDSGRISLDR